MNTHVVIMAGGIGSRFWPLSTPEFPKQFVDILGCGRTLIQLTVDRFNGICPIDNFWVVTNTKYVDIVKSQIPDIQEKHILAEPVARNTAPCIAWACWKIKAEDPCANVVVTPSDAVVMNTEEFRKVISNALAFTLGNDSIVTIGIKPNRPETGYGYVETDGELTKGICPVKEFKEKPDFETAQRYLNTGKFLWNAGIFVWKVKTIAEVINKYNTQTCVLMNRISESFGQRNEQDVVEELFPLCESISIDYAVMEPASKEGIVYTFPANLGWSDLGNWASLHEKLQKDDKNNAAIGDVKFYECSNCVVHTEGTYKVILQGLEGYIVSEKSHKILVCKLSEEQRIKAFSIE